MTYALFFSWCGDNCLKLNFGPLIIQLGLGHDCYCVTWCPLLSVVLTLEAASLGNSASSGGRKKGRPLGIFSAQQVRGNTWGNRAVVVDIIRMMTETLWICRYISIWKRMKSPWTWPGSSGFLFLPLLTSWSESKSFFSVLFPQITRPEWRMSDLSFAVSVLNLHLPFSSPLQGMKGEAARGGGSNPEPETGHVDSGPGDGPLHSPHKAPCPWLGWEGDGLDSGVVNHWPKSSPQKCLLWPIWSLKIIQVTSRI